MKKEVEAIHTIKGGNPDGHGVLRVVDQLCPHQVSAPGTMVSIDKTAEERLNLLVGPFSFDVRLWVVCTTPCKTALSCPGEMIDVGTHDCVSLGFGQPCNKVHGKVCLHSCIAHLMAGSSGSPMVYRCSVEENFLEKKAQGYILPSLAFCDNTAPAPGCRCPRRTGKRGGIR